MNQIPEVLPHDVYNEALVSNVRPTDWQNPDPASRYNLVVIGAGTAGLVTAAGAAGLGAKVALVERHLLGGDCLNVGCVPSKCIIRSSRVVADLRDASQFGIRGPQSIEADFPGVMERMRRLRARISDNDSARRFKELGVDVFLGEGRFTGADTLEVEGKTLKFKKAVIATGTRPVHPAIEGIAEVGFLTNGKRVGLIGPTASLIPDAFFRKGVNVMAGIRILNPDLMLKILMHGGSGYHLLKDCSEKIAFLKR